MDAAAEHLAQTLPARCRKVHTPIMRGEVFAGRGLSGICGVNEGKLPCHDHPANRSNFDTLAVRAYSLASDERLGRICHVIAVHRRLWHYFPCCYLQLWQCVHLPRPARHHALKR